MAKMIFLFIAALLYLQGGEKAAPPVLQSECLQCHDQQKIPSEAIYRRYLLKYSSKALMKKKIFSYLRDPSEKKSIMPPQFFRKFSVKEASDLDDESLQQRVDAYINYFDIDKKLIVLPENN